MNYAARLREDRFLVLLFHGVIERQTHAVRNYNRKHLEADYFRAVLRALLDAGGHPVAMDEVAASHAAGEPLPPRSFAVTFDDGFSNNIEIAAPILDDLRVPAAFYITSDFVQSNRMSWVDRIEWAVEQARTVRLRLPWGDVEAAPDPAGKRRVLDDIRRHVKEDRRIVADDLASQIQAQLGVPETWSSDDPLDRKLTWEQVRALASHPLFTVGGHSHTHAILSFLSKDALESEIDQSLDLLRARAGVGSRHYAYPEGLAHCYSDEVIAVLRQRGVEVCPSAIDGDNDVSTDLFSLRRVMVI